MIMKHLILFIIFLILIPYGNYWGIIISLTEINAPEAKFIAFDKNDGSESATNICSEKLFTSIVDKST